MEFIHGICKLKYHAILGLANSRKMVDRRVLKYLHKQGQLVYLVDLKISVTVCWYYLKCENCRLEKRFVLSTKPLKASTIKR